MSLFQKEPQSQRNRLDALARDFTTALRSVQTSNDNMALEPIGNLGRQLIMLLQTAGFRILWPADIAKAVLRVTAPSPLFPIIASVPLIIMIATLKTMMGLTLVIQLVLGMILMLLIMRASAIQLITKYIESGRVPPQFQASHTPLREFLLNHNLPTRYENILAKLEFVPEIAWHVIRWKQTKAGGKTIYMLRPEVDIIHLMNPVALWIEPSEGTRRKRRIHHTAPQGN